KKITPATKFFLNPFYTNRMLKKSVLDFFSHDLAGLPPSNPYKLLDFSVSQLGNPSPIKGIA
ncbi:MAG: hypothetical protein Q7T24_02905, partial [Deltaproteobacteria bacterium]|nr:hypothetical protein [Deltaproteobacteria bacterium]